LNLRTEKIIIKADDDPEKISNDFCKKHNLNDKMRDMLLEGLFN
jgi:hypothetical protein